MTREDRIYSVFLEITEDKFSRDPYSKWEKSHIKKGAIKGLGAGVLIGATSNVIRKGLKNRKGKEKFFKGTGKAALKGGAVGGIIGTGIGAGLAHGKNKSLSKMGNSMAGDIKAHAKYARSTFRGDNEFKIKNHDGSEIILDRKKRSVRMTGKPIRVNLNDL